MPRQLLILRHAKSSWDSGASSDFERPLGPRGEKDAPRMGEFMHTRELRPDHVVSSPAKRAAETVLAVCAALDIKAQHIHWDRRVYAAKLSDLLQVLSEVPAGAERVLLVGHNPGLEDLLVHLWGREAVIPPNGKVLPTATLAEVALPKDWNGLAQGAARSVSITRPKDID